MINPLSSLGATLSTGKVGAVSKPSAVSSAKAAKSGEASAPTPAADLAALGPPVDVDKVSRIRAAIANGSYTIDVQAIASRMVDYDLPGAQ